MAAVILKFKIPEEQDELKLAQDGSALHAAAYDFSNWIREQTKYEHRKTVTMDELHKAFWDRFGDLL